MPYVNVFDDLENTVFDIIDAADKKGYTHFVKPQRYLPKNVSLKSQAALREVLQSTMQPHYLFVSSAKNWPTALEASKTVLDNGDWLVGFNAAKFFFLPGERPAAELTELRVLFDAMKPYFEAYAQAPGPAVVRLMNERDGHKRVYGSLTCIAEGADASDFAEALQARIDASPTLQHFQRGYALALGKIGRYSWGDLREEHFFAARQRPWSEAFCARRRQSHPVT